jgi:hypothetical protein
MVKKAAMCSKKNKRSSVAKAKDARRDSTDRDVETARDETASTSLERSCDERGSEHGGDDVARPQLVSTKQEDHLVEDEAVNGQAFTCVSFVSPSDILPRKDAFFFERYIRDVFVPKATAFADAVALTPEKVAEFAAGFKADAVDVGVDFAAFCSNNQTTLEDEFAASNPYSLTTEGFKVRGSYPTIEAARRRAEALRDVDASVDVFVAQVGAWCPFNPRPESVGEVVYQESELNTLMKMKREAEARKDEIYRTSTDVRVDSARREGGLPIIEEVAEEEEGIEEEIGEEGNDEEA